ncbi:hypothetical protein [Tepidibacter mesophilus]|uniref:hypothetical protein n=1 Tax=Tepidibacter mesophilus TaxID=655607 RepID=UPI000C08CF0A|nr:hypothetical protein [Tepidibacter mesophilus]
MSKEYKNPKKYDDSVGNQDKTEYAPELTADSKFYKKEKGKDSTNANIMGYLAVFASVVSLFTYPVTFGVIGIILGIMSIYSGAKTLGYWAIGIGIVTSVASLFFRVALFSYMFSMFYR